MKDYSEQEIDDFLLNRLTNNERGLFETKIAEDSAFAQLVKQRQEAIQYINVLGDQALRKRVSALHKEAVKDLSDKPKFQLSRFIKYAAAAVILLGFSVWYLNTLSSSPDVFNNYYQAYDLNFGDRSSSPEDLIASAGRFYQNEDYANALKTINQLPTADVSGKVLLAKGISALELEDLSVATTSFQQLINQKDPIYEQHAKWYLAMTFFKSGKDIEAKELLEELVKSPNAFNQDKAKQILD